MKKRVMKKYIPTGLYCYNSNGTCKWWGNNKNKPYQMNGYCKYLKIGDWDFEHISLLWDKCKECGVREYYESEK